MKFSSMGSGSKGNALLVSASDGATITHVMLDCGFSVRETERRLARSGVAPSALSAILVTHEHSDHAGSVFQFASRHNLPVWMSYGTFHALGGKSHDLDICFCRDGDELAIGDLAFTAFTVPHDAREPLQFHVTDGTSKLGILTDVGQITPHLSDALRGCDALIIECNHDRQMLAQSAYPYFLKQRISSMHGHLSNEDAAHFIGELDQVRLKKIVAAHLSQQNNTPELVAQQLQAAIQSSRTEMVIACQDNGFDWIMVG